MNRNKEWFEFYLVNGDNKEEQLIAKVKSMGLANLIKKQLEEAYKTNTQYKIIMK